MPKIIFITKDEIPKPMANLYGKPILQWAIENLKFNGQSDNINENEKNISITNNIRWRNRL